MRNLVRLFVVLLSIHSLTATAEWCEVSSAHFVIYANDTVDELKNFAERLERYNSAMSVVFPAKSSAPSPSNRLTIYVVQSEALVRELYGAGKNAKFINGFYIPKIGDAIAIVPPVTSSSGRDASEAEQNLLHEYAHYFMFANALYQAPEWFREGFAEYFSTAKFYADGSVGLGLPAPSRATELQRESNVSIEQLLDSKAYAARKSKNYDNFYGRSWLMFHYFYSDQQRTSQLKEYLTRFNRGEGELESATKALGELQQLDVALKSYAKQQKFQAVQVPGTALNVGAIKVRQLSEAEAATLPIRMRSDRGVNDLQAAALVLTARKVAMQYPLDAEVQAALAEAEYNAGHNEAAIAAADLALAKKPTHTNALIQKGYALTDIAARIKLPEAWLRAREHFAAITQIEADNPIALLYYYLSFQLQGSKPSELAIHGLERAMELAPYDRNTRMLTAKQQMQDARYEAAIKTLTPLANDRYFGEKNPALVLLVRAKEAMANGEDVDNDELGGYEEEGE